jgi:hypothetical protein
MNPNKCDECEMKVKAECTDMAVYIFTLLGLVAGIIIGAVLKSGGLL